MPLMPRFGDDPDDLMGFQILRDLSGHERELSAMPGREVCDFCHAPDPVWLFGCGDVTIMSVAAVGHAGVEDHNSQDEWTACEKCKFLVDRSQVKRLADRCARLMLDNMRTERPELADRLPPLREMRRDMTRLQQAFWKNRRRELDRPFVRRTHGDRHR